jgi:hypothetical protein
MSNSTLTTFSANLNQDSDNSSSTHKGCDLSGTAWAKGSSASSLGTDTCIGGISASGTNTMSGIWDVSGGLGRDAGIARLPNFVPVDIGLESLVPSETNGPTRGREAASAALLLVVVELDFWAEVEDACLDSKGTAFAGAASGALARIGFENCAAKGAAWSD